MSDSGSGGGGATKVPITGTPTADGATTYNNTACNQYTVQISSTDGLAHAVTMTASPGGVSLDPLGMSVPATGYASVTVYVPTTVTGTVTLSVSQTGIPNPTTVTVTG